MGTWGAILGGSLLLGIIPGHLHKREWERFWRESFLLGIIPILDPLPFTSAFTQISQMWQQTYGQIKFSDSPGWITIRSLYTRFTPISQIWLQTDC
jgi:hypothetical protein